MVHAVDHPEQTRRVDPRDAGLDGLGREQPVVRSRQRQGARAGVGADVDVVEGVGGQQGFGLGLAIAEAAARRFGGRLELFDGDEGRAVVAIVVPRRRT